MPRVIILDSFPLSSTAKQEPLPGAALSTLDRCHVWVQDCVRAGHRVVAPAICGYEVRRELERLRATAQIARLHAFCRAVPDRYLLLTDPDLNRAASLWAQARNAGMPTAGPESLDADVILAAQALSLGLPASEFIVATTNVGHLSRFVPCDLWTNIAP